MSRNNSTDETPTANHPLNQLCDILVRLEKIELKHWEGLDDETNDALQHACDAAGTPIEKFLAKAEMQRSVLEKDGQDTTYDGIEHLPGSDPDSQEKRETSDSMDIPWVLARERLEDHTFNERYSAAKKHANKLTKSENAIMEAKDFANILYHSLSEADDYFEMTVQTVVKRIQKLLDRASDRLDRHGTNHTNLFIAYFDLKEDRDA